MGALSPIGGAAALWDLSPKGALFALPYGGTAALWGTQPYRGRCSAMGALFAQPYRGRCSAMGRSAL